MNKNLIGSLVFMAMGLALLLPGLYMLLGTARQILGTQTARGMVVEIRHRSAVKSAGTAMAYPLVKFKAGNGLEYAVQTTRGYSGSIPFQEGDEVDVLYDPSNPQEARIGSFFEIWGPATLLTLFGLTFVAAGVAAHGRFR